MEKVYYCIPTYKSFDLAYDGVLAALRSTLVPDKIVIIDNSGDGSGTLHLTPLTAKFSNVYIWPQVQNLGVAKSWNTFHEQLDSDNIIIANDDVQVHPYTIEHLVNAAKSNTKEVLFTGASASGNAFSLFLLTQRGFKLNGPFDTRFYPAYFEDNDYAYRLKLKGYNVVQIEEATFIHIGSSTMARYTPDELEQHHINFRRNQAYYRSKWGNLPYKEVYTQAFGGII